MIRTTQVASKIVVTIFGLDGKKAESFELHEKDAWFADLANTLDHCRNTGLAPAEAVKR